MKLLVADDEPISRHLITRVLTDSGFEVVCASDGGVAWQLLCAEDPPHMVILDWMMPKLNGIELCRKIRASQAPHYIYIILLTVRTNKVDLLAALGAGADDYLTKPFVRDELTARVRIGWRVLQKEDQLSRINQEWRTLLDHLPFGVACLGPNGELKRANKVFFELLGYSDMKALLGKSLGERVIPNQAHFQGLLERIRTSGSVDRVEVEMVSRDGSHLHRSIWARVINLPNEVMFEIITDVE